MSRAYGARRGTGRPARRAANGGQPAGTERIRRGERCHRWGNETVRVADEEW